MTVPPTLIRLADPADAAALAGLRWQWNAETGLPAEPLDAFAGRLTEWIHRHQHSHEALVAVSDGSVVAMAWLAAQDRLPDPGTAGHTHGELQSVYVLPANRGGVGSDLVRAAIIRATDRGMPVLTVRPGSRSRPFYRRLGFDGDGAVLQRTLSRSRG